MSMTAAGRYLQLASQREPFLTRAREAAKLTIPTLVPPDGHGPHTKYYTPFQSIGARGVNNLAAKLLLALLPPNSPFFKLLIDDFMVDKMTQQPGMRGQVDKALNKIERSVMTEIEAKAMRISAFEALKQAIVAGNCLVYAEETMRIFRLDRYVVSRDPMGNVLEIITEEDISREVLPQILKETLEKPENEKSPEKTLKLYTWVRRNGTHWTVHQEIGTGQMVPNSKGTYPLDKSPWMPLRWTKIDGEDYGRGYVEEFLGDLRSLEGLTQSIVEGSAASAKVLFLVSPNGTTKMKEVAEAPNGAIRNGNAADVTVIQTQKHADFQVALSAIERIEGRISAAFLLAASVTRQAERVTAEEIRIMASELEDALGGVYSILSQEFQLPLVTRVMFRMERRGQLPSLPKGMVRPAITTGLEALGRGQDQNRLRRFLGNLEPLGPEVIAQYLNVPEFIARMGVSEGIEMDGLIRSAEEVAQAQQQAQLAAMGQQMLPGGMQILRDQLDPSKNGPQVEG